MDFSDLLHKMHELLAEHQEVRDQFRQRFEYVLVDEMQDTNHVQLGLLRELVGEDVPICAVGDDDQSIYGWRGARVENMLDFEASFPGAEIIRMEENYRSTGNILAAAHSIIEHNRRRHAKELFTRKEKGELLLLVEADTEYDEAQKVMRRVKEYNKQGTGLGSMAVFFRTNAQSRSLEEVLSKERIPHVVIGGIRFYERAEVKDALAYLRVISNPRDEVSLIRIINRPTRGIGNTGLRRMRDVALTNDCTLYDAIEIVRNRETEEKWEKPFREFGEMLEKWCGRAGDVDVSTLAMEILDESGYLEKLQSVDKIEAQSRLENLTQLVSSIREQEEKNESLTLQDYLEQVALITDIDSWSGSREHLPLMTIHAAKGLEFDVVFVTGMEDGLLPHQNHLDDGDLEEERRLCYVALTRARKKVVLSHARSRMRFGTTEFYEVSRFVGELDQELVEEEAARARGSFMSTMKRKRPHLRRAGDRPATPPPGKAGRRKVVPGADWAGKAVLHSNHGTGTVLAAVADQVVVRFDNGKLATVHANSLEFVK